MKILSDVIMVGMQTAQVVSPSDEKIELTIGPNGWGMSPQQAAELGEAIILLARARGAEVEKEE